ncbi:Ger(x)C family spore germination protein [Paenibacillus sp. GCM10012307]|uniref:Ger(X)C family spore germination protein n=1 Tax=Paenibacillus roseus TaxID=2798579 RepID=A0A934J4R6_9BACL|nr:Ger(x)C family spore germination protein [Paenibacillus roseus]MBJ6360322.1 Ger(x)C family spore germination protein [Paenibacillus roseus]
MSIWIKRLLLVLMLLSVAAGCGENSKSIQNLAFVTAIGLDYQDGRFYSYTQVLNFIDVAKTEQIEIGKNVPVWIGRGVGKTVNESLASIYPTSQLRMYWGHVKGILCSERLLEQLDDMRDIFDAVNRYREVRYNINVYSTKEPLPLILSQKSVLYFSPLDTLLDNPSQSYIQNSIIPPQYVYRLISEFNESGRTAMLPSLSISDGRWTEDTTKRTLLYMDGTSFFFNHQYIGKLPVDQMDGLKWLRKETRRAIINIPDNNNPAATLVIVKPRHKIKPVVENNRVRYVIHVKAKGYVDEMIQDLSIQEMERQAAQVLKQQIMATYEQGLARQIDVLNLNYKLYTSKPKEWKRLEKIGRLKLEKDTIQDIQVKVKLTHTGKYKGRTYK